MTRGSPGATAMEPVNMGLATLAVPPVPGARPQAAVYRMVVGVGTAVMMNVPSYPAGETPAITSSSPTEKPWGVTVVMVTVVPVWLAELMLTGTPCSNIGVQEKPPSLLFQAPPPAVE